MKEDLKRLLESAEEDLSSAKVLFREKCFRISSFHSQQAVEKFLKSYLLYKKNYFPFIHSIKGLIQKCLDVDKEFEYLLKMRADKLDKYYTGARYLPLLEVSEEEAKEAVEIAEKVKKFVLEKLKGWKS